MQPEPEFDDTSPTVPSIPHNREAEEAVLGSVLINPDMFYEVQNILVADDFYIHRHRWIWNAFVAIAESGKDIDMLTVADELDRVGKLSEIGGPAYLTGLINQVPTSLNIVSYATIVEGGSVRRKMINEANALAKLAYSNKTTEDILCGRDKLVSSSALVSSGQDDTQDSDEASLDLMQKITGKIPTGVRSHFPLFDSPEQLGGFPIGGTLLIGDSSFGKSAFCLQACEQVALGGQVALYCGLESTNDAMVMRRVGGRSGVEPKKVRTASLTQAEENKLVGEITGNYQGKYGGRLKFNSRANTIQMVERAIRKYKPKFVVIDQISQVTDQPSTNQTLNLLSNFTRLKALGNKYDCAVLVVHAISPDESKLFFAKNAKSASGKKQKNAVPSVNAIPWASQMKFLADVMLILVPDVNQVLANASVYDIIIWIMKDRDGSRFMPTKWDYDLKLQWFTDKPVNPQVPPVSSQIVMPVPYSDPDYLMVDEEDEEDESE